MVMAGRNDPTRIKIFPNFKQHMDAREIREAVGRKIWDKYYKFTIERNPYDRLVSFYKWRSHRFGLQCTFEDFAHSLLNGTRRFGSAESGFSNRPFYLDNSYNICVDKVIMFEQLENDLNETLSSIGLQGNPAYLPNLKSNIRDGQSYRDFYTDQLLQLARNKFSLEERIFGYDF